MKINRFARGRNIKRSWLAVLGIVAMLLGMMFTPGVGHVQASVLGTVVAWGRNLEGQTNIPAGLSDVTAISAGNYHNLALKNDGTVVAWGCVTLNNAPCTVPAGLSDVTAISAGGYHNLALKNDGTVVAWGLNGNGQTNVPDGLSGVKAIAAGGWHSLALKSDGTVIAWGDSFYHEADVPAGLSDVIAIEAGTLHSLALKGDGTVVAWGNDGNGQTNVPDGLSGVIAISAGGYHNLALKSDGTVVAWGLNDDGQTNIPDGLSGVKAISAGTWHSLALKNEGTVVAWGWNNLGQSTIPTGLSGVTAIGGGDMHSLALVQTVPGSHPPSALDDSYSTNQNTTITVVAPGVLSNDTDEDGDLLSAILVSGPGNGTLTLNADGSFTYTPAANYAGTDSFTYKVNDGELVSNIATVNIAIQYSFAGFFEPVDNPGPGPRYIFNSVKAGSGIPVKFSLEGDRSLDIFSPGYPTSRPVKCATAARTDPIEQTVSAGNSSLNYDIASDTYTYVWKTENNWAGTCRVLTVQLDDGTQHLAYFRFK
jgi:alpha-tubulin suppressor-like RCC1 family protein